MRPRNLAWGEHGHQLGECWRETGSVAPGQMGGHRPKSISGEHRTWLLERMRERDFTLRGLVAELADAVSRLITARCGASSTPRS